MRKSIIYILILSLALGACEKENYYSYAENLVSPVGNVQVTRFDKEAGEVYSNFVNQYGDVFEEKLLISHVVNYDSLFEYLETSSMRLVRYESISQEYVTEDLSLVPAEGNLEITNFDDNLK